MFVATNFALEKLYPLVVKNGVIILDDYKHVSGTTRSVNQFLKKKENKNT